MSALSCLLLCTVVYVPRRDRIRMVTKTKISEKCSTKAMISNLFSLIFSTQRRLVIVGIYQLKNSMEILV